MCIWQWVYIEVSMSRKRLDREVKETIKQSNACDILLTLYMRCESTKGSFKLLHASRHIRGQEQQCKRSG